MARKPAGKNDSSFKIYMRPPNAAGTLPNAHKDAKRMRQHHDHVERKPCAVGTTKPKVTAAFTDAAEAKAVPPPNSCRDVHRNRHSPPENRRRHDGG